VRSGMMRRRLAIKDEQMILKAMSYNTNEFSAKWLNVGYSD
jgi:hypothetical protein